MAHNGCNNPLVTVWMLKELGSTLMVSNTPASGENSQVWFKGQDILNSKNDCRSLLVLVLSYCSSFPFTLSPSSGCWIPFSHYLSKSFWIGKCQFLFRRTTWYQEQEEIRATVCATLTIPSWAITHLVPVLVGFSSDVTGEHLKDALLTSQLFSPHFQELLPGRLALQVEEVIVLQFPKGWRGGVTPVRGADTADTPCKGINRPLRKMS